MVWKLEAQMYPSKYQYSVDRLERREYENKEDAEDIAKMYAEEFDIVLFVYEKDDQDDDYRDEYWYE